MPLVHSDPDCLVQRDDTCDRLLGIVHQFSESLGVAIDARTLDRIHDFGRHVFLTRLDRDLPPRGDLYFKGEAGHRLAPPGSRVIILATTVSCRCAGNCRNCSCRQEDKGEPVQTAVNE